MRFENVAQTLRYTSSRTSLNTQKLTGNLTMDMGNLTANGVAGPFDLATRDKDILLENFKLNVKIVNSNGDVHLETNTLPTHPIEVTSRKGDLTLALPAQSSFVLNALSNNGEVSCDFPGMKVSQLPGKGSASGISAIWTRRTLPGPAATGSAAMPIESRAAAASSPPTATSGSARPPGSRPRRSGTYDEARPTS